MSPYKPVIIVTGASRGLGSHIALAFGAKKNRVVINYRSHERAAVEIADSINRQGGEAFAFRADVTRSNDVELMISETIQRWSRIDALVNNAGIAMDGILLRMSENAWDDVISVNLRGPFICTRSVAAVMMKQLSGHIINISSIVGIQGREGQANYSASKAGLIGLTRETARELGPFDIKVNAVIPGYIQTEMGKSLSNSAISSILDNCTLGRASELKEVADFIVHLSTMNNVSGQVFNLDSRIL